MWSSPWGTRGRGLRLASGRTSKTGRTPDWKLLEDRPEPEPGTVTEPDPEPVTVVAAEPEPVTVVEPESPEPGTVAEPDPEPEPGTEGATRAWLEQALTERNLVERMVRIIRRRYPVEDADDVRGKVHEMIAYWAHNGSLDAELAQGNEPSPSRLAAWVANRIKGDLNKRGRDGLWRCIRGSRTLTEYQTGEVHAVTSDDAYEAHSIVGDDEQVVGMEVIDPTPNIEQVHCTGIPRERVVAALQVAIRSAHPKKATRYLQVLEDVVLHQEDAASTMQERDLVSNRRAHKLIGRVRDDIRQAGWSVVSHARAVLWELVREPYSTLDEMVVELRIPRPDLVRAVRLLEASGYIEHAGNNSYCPTDGGRDAIEMPVTGGSVGALLI